MEIADYITVGSILAAISIYFLGYRERIRFERRQNTTAILSKFYDAGPVIEANTIIASWIADNRLLPDDEVSAEEDSTIIAILNYYDFLALMVREESVDSAIVLASVGGPMIETYKVTENYINARRKRLNRPKLYSALEGYVNRFGRKLKSLS